MNACMWAILTNYELKFIYNSLGFKLENVTLFDLIHPEEIVLAKKDLCQFMKSKSLSGSVTKCRIIDYNKKCVYSSWLVVDIVMYVATEELVLAFFHQEKGPVCGMTNSNIQHLLEPVKRTLRTVNKQQNHVFHILDSQTKSALLSCPEYNSIIDDRSPVSPGTVSCFRCVQQPSRITLSGLTLKSLWIDYGMISFIITLTETSHSPKAVVYFNLKRNYRYKTSVVPVDELLPKRINTCQNCGTQSSPEWRKGPNGHKTLCNACGLRYSRSIARQEKMTRCSHSILELAHFLCKNSP